MICLWGVLLCLTTCVIFFSAGQNQPCSKSCSNGGICSVLEDGRQMCYCPEGIFGDECEKRFFYPDPCVSLKPCQSSEICLIKSTECDVNDGPCPPQYFCGFNTTDRGCAQSPCLNGGTCYEIRDSMHYICVCPSGFVGEHCSKSAVGVCEKLSPCHDERYASRGNKRDIIRGSDVICTNIGNYDYQCSCPTNNPTSNCTRQAICPPLKCAANCSFFGFKTDASTNCPSCECNNPCESIDCAVGQVCILKQVHCLQAPCPPVTSCVTKDKSICDNKPCAPEAYCEADSSSEDGYRCACPWRKTGKRCYLDQADMSRLCDPCRNGYCTNVDVIKNDVVCRCNAGYVGRSCMTYLGAPCLAKSCKLEERCVPLSDLSVTQNQATTECIAYRRGYCPPVNWPALVKAAFVDEVACNSSCSVDNDCADPRHKCCFVGCGTSCVLPRTPGACERTRDDYRMRVSGMREAVHRLDHVNFLSFHRTMRRYYSNQLLRVYYGVMQTYQMKFVTHVSDEKYHNMSIAASYRDKNRFTPYFDYECGRSGVKFIGKQCYYINIERTRPLKCVCVKESNGFIKSLIAIPPALKCSEKAGKCPSYKYRVCDRQKDECALDYDCGMGDSKCCYNGCNKQCTRIAKVGSCPSSPIPRKKDLPCVMECFMDSDCPDTDKCCHSSCSNKCSPLHMDMICWHSNCPYGSTCVPSGDGKTYTCRCPKGLTGANCSEIVHHAGMCPGNADYDLASFYRLISDPRQCTSMCMMDGDCAIDEKCCISGCRKTCQKAVSTDIRPCHRYNKNLVKSLEISKNLANVTNVTVQQYVDAIKSSFFAKHPDLILKILALDENSLKKLGHFPYSLLVKLSHGVFKQFNCTKDGYYEAVQCFDGGCNCHHSETGKLIIPGFSNCSALFCANDVCARGSTCIADPFAGYRCLCRHGYHGKQCNRKVINPGYCPPVLERDLLHGIQSGNCSRVCDSDQMCGTNEKCCDVGCSSTCVPVTKPGVTHCLAAQSRYYHAQNTLQSLAAVYNLTFHVVITQLRRSMLMQTITEMTSLTIDDIWATTGPKFTCDQYGQYNSSVCRVFSNNTAESCYCPDSIGQPYWTPPTYHKDPTLNCTAVRSVCDGNPCGTRGVCRLHDPLTATAKCWCLPGFAGRYCGIKRDDVQFTCKDKGCENPNEKCVTKTDCRKNKAGHVCFDVHSCIVDTVPCRNNPCQYGSTCQRSRVTGRESCHCLPGFTGIHCETMILHDGVCPWNNGSNVIRELATSPEKCYLSCSHDDMCSDAEKCCQVGCSTECLPARDTGLSVCQQRKVTMDRLRQNLEQWLLTDRNITVGRALQIITKNRKYHKYVAILNAAIGTDVDLSAVITRYRDYPVAEALGILAKRVAVMYNVSCESDGMFSDVQCSSYLNVPEFSLEYCTCVDPKLGVPFGRVVPHRHLNCTEELGRHICPDYVMHRCKNKALCEVSRVHRYGYKCHCEPGFSGTFCEHKKSKAGHCPSIDAMVTYGHILQGNCTHECSSDYDCAGDRKCCGVCPAKCTKSLNKDLGPCGVMKARYTSHQSVLLYFSTRDDLDLQSVWTMIQGTSMEEHLLKLTMQTPDALIRRHGHRRLNEVLKQLVPRHLIECTCTENGEYNSSVCVRTRGQPPKCWCPDRYGAPLWNVHFSSPRSCSDLERVCRPNPCKNGGQCRLHSEKDLTVVCLCPHGYSGRICESPTKPLTCASVTCDRGLVCDYKVYCDKRQPGHICHKRPACQPAHRGSCPPYQLTPASLYKLVRYPSMCDIECFSDRQCRPMEKCCQQGCNTRCVPAIDKQLGPCESTRRRWRDMKSTLRMLKMVRGVTIGQLIRSLQTKSNYKQYLNSFAATLKTDMRVGDILRRYSNMTISEVVTTVEATLPMPYPECTEDGRFRRVQCMDYTNGSVAFCHCVHINNGTAFGKPHIQRDKLDCEGVKREIRPGLCPHQLNSAAFLRGLRDRSCMRECHTDAQCGVAEKCCQKGCGFVCTAPTMIYTHPCKVDSLRFNRSITVLTTLAMARLNRTLQELWNISQRFTQTRQLVTALFSQRDIDTFIRDSSIMRRTMSEVAYGIPLLKNFQLVSCTETGAYSRMQCRGYFSGTRHECYCIDDQRRMVTRPQPYPWPKCAATPVDKCDLNPCMNGGTCYINPGRQRQCNCTRGYTGKWCEKLVSRTMKPGLCPNKLSVPYFLRGVGRRSDSWKCESDGDCGGQDKCCLTGSGSSCVYPIMLNSPLCEVDSLRFNRSITVLTTLAMARLNRTLQELWNISQRFTQTQQLVTALFSQRDIDTFIRDSSIMRRTMSEVAYGIPLLKNFQLVSCTETGAYSRMQCRGYFSGTRHECYCIDDQRRMVTRPQPYPWPKCAATPVDKCDLNPCMNGGTCYINPGRQRQCNCTRGYTGKWCEKLVSRTMKPGLCPNKLSVPYFLRGVGRRSDSWKCESDGDCGGQDKCCLTGSGSSCVYPIMLNSPACEVDSLRFNRSITVLTTLAMGRLNRTLQELWNISQRFTQTRQLVTALFSQRDIDTFIRDSSIMRRTMSEVAYGIPLLKNFQLVSCTEMGAYSHMQCRGYFSGTRHECYCIDDQRRMVTRPQPYPWPKCEETPKEECDPNPCKFGGSCRIDAAGMKHCQCMKGFIGKWCERLVLHRGTCPPNNVTPATVFKFVWSPRMCSINCVSDGQCGHTEKCCQRGCSTRCVRAVNTGYTACESQRHSLRELTSTIRVLYTIGNITVRQLVNAMETRPNYTQYLNSFAATLKTDMRVGDVLHRFSNNTLHEMANMIMTTVPFPHRNCTSEGHYDRAECMRYMDGSFAFCRCVHANGTAYGKPSKNRVQLHCPVSRTMKPGLCPNKLSVPDFLRGVGRRSDSWKCESDSDCGGQDKCCLMGSGSNCVYPIMLNSPPCEVDSLRFNRSITVLTTLAMARLNRTLQELWNISQRFTQTRQLVTALFSQRDIDTFIRDSSIMRRTMSEVAYGIPLLKNFQLVSCTETGAYSRMQCRGYFSGTRHECYCIDDQRHMVTRPQPYPWPKCAVTPVDECDPNPCMNGGTCYINPGRQRQCNCTRGYTGKWCEKLVSRTMKPGLCPNKLSVPDFLRGVGHRSDSWKCESDGECGGQDKCCLTGSGSNCVYPIMLNSPLCEVDSLRFNRSITVLTTLAMARLNRTLQELWNISQRFTQTQQLVTALFSQRDIDTFIRDSSIMRRTMSEVAYGIPLLKNFQLVSCTETGAYSRMQCRGYFSGTRHECYCIDDQRRMVTRPQPYPWPKCEETPKEECDPNPCKFGGSCHMDAAGMKHCQCMKGFIGKWCERLVLHRGVCPSDIVTPATLYKLVKSPQMCSINCISDGQCGHTEKCCQRGCSTRCVPAVNRSLKPCQMRKHMLSELLKTIRSLYDVTNVTVSDLLEALRTQRRYRQYLDSLSAILRADMNIEDILIQYGQLSIGQLLAMTVQNLPVPSVNCSSNGSYPRHECLVYFNGTVAMCQCVYRHNGTAYGPTNRDPKQLRCHGDPTEVECRTNSCQFGASCIENRKSGEKRCLCRAGFRGVHCEILVTHKGSCPTGQQTLESLYELIRSPEKCSMECISDGQCYPYEKCCHDGCSTQCVPAIYRNYTHCETRRDALTGLKHTLMTLRSVRNVTVRQLLRALENKPNYKQYLNSFAATLKTDIRVGDVLPRYSNKTIGEVVTMTVATLPMPYPTCTEDGRFNRVQCMLYTNGSSAFCYCVHLNNGTAYGTPRHDRNELECAVRRTHVRKAGMCPHMFDVSGFMRGLEDRLCRWQCEGDEDCGGQDKCCQRGCGSTCVHPIMLNSSECQVDEVMFNRSLAVMTSVATSQIDHSLRRLWNLSRFFSQVHHMIHALYGQMDIDKFVRNSKLSGHKISDLVYVIPLLQNFRLVSCTETGAYSRMQCRGYFSGTRHECYCIDDQRRMITRPQTYPWPHCRDVKPTKKPGVCGDLNVAMYLRGIDKKDSSCVWACQGDNNCPNNEKCCQSGCGSKCVIPNLLEATECQQEEHIVKQGLRAMRQVATMKVTMTVSDLWKRARTFSLVRHMVAALFGTEDVDKLIQKSGYASYPLSQLVYGIPLLKNFQLVSCTAKGAYSRMQCRGYFSGTRHECYCIDDQRRMVTRPQPYPWPECGGAMYCDSGKQECTIPKCDRSCNYGNERDDNNCFTCTCKVTPCSAKLCGAGTMCVVNTVGLCPGMECKATASCSACALHPCLNGATCNDEPDGGYTCDCANGYFGETCSNFLVKPGVCVQPLMSRSGLRSLLSLNVSVEACPQYCGVDGHCDNDLKCCYIDCQQTCVDPSRREMSKCEQRKYTMDEQRRLVSSLFDLTNFTFGDFTRHVARYPLLHATFLRVLELTRKFMADPSPYLVTMSFGEVVKAIYKGKQWTVVSCAPNGLYNPVQCTERRDAKYKCYCVHERTGVMYGNYTTWPKLPTCKDTRCDDVMCEMYCRHGYIKDKYGCPTCACRDDPCSANQNPCLWDKTCILGDNNRCPGMDCESRALCTSCVKNPCMNNGTCIDVSSSLKYNCRCPVGYRGRHCEQLIEHDGVCPNVMMSSRVVYQLFNDPQSCTVDCVNDASCDVSEKCCVSGCSYTCTPAIGTDWSACGRDNYTVSSKWNTLRTYTNLTAITLTEIYYKFKTFHIHTYQFLKSIGLGGNITSYLNFMGNMSAGDAFSQMLIHYTMISARCDDNGTYAPIQCMQRSTGEVVECFCFDPVLGKRFGQAYPAGILPACKDCPPGTEKQGDICVECGYGQYRSEISGSSCVPCPHPYNTSTPRATLATECSVFVPSVCDEGSFYHVNRSECQPCPIRMHQPEAGQYKCIHCPTGQTTYMPGSSRCLKDCELGWEYDSNITDCIKCSKGFYRTKETMKCMECSPGSTTEQPGSTTPANCSLGDCDAGYRMNATYPLICEPCPQGTYQYQRQQRDCIPCEDRYTTHGEGSVTSTNCSVMVPSKCLKGHYETDEGTCKPCPLGQYQNDTGQYSCKLCDVGYTTLKLGSATCVVDCPSGSELNETLSGCVNCSQGYYRQRGQSDNCIPCPLGTTNWNPGSHACNLGDCEEGFHIDPDQPMLCVACEIGTYQPVPLRWSCEPCPKTYTTLREGSINASQCSKRIASNCTRGFFYNLTLEQCIECDRGEYQSSDGQYSCDRCPFGMTSFDPTYCIKDCPSGQEYDEGGEDCITCTRGYHRNKNISDYCDRCPPDLTTETEGSVSQDSCLVGNCQPGYHIGSVNHTECVECDVGYYQNLPLQPDCIQCPDTYTTATKRSTKRSDCSLRMPSGCVAGQYLDNGQCKPCPLGQYQSMADQYKCEVCDDGQTTYTTGHTRCYPSCPDGQYTNGTGCVDCPIGSYRDISVQTNGQCELCDQGLTTMTAGSSSSSDCNLGDCQPGTFRDPRDKSVCKKCPRGYFQDIKWQNECKKCQANLTTHNKGSNSSDKCRLKVSRDGLCPTSTISAASIHRVIADDPGCDAACSDDLSCPTATHKCCPSDCSRICTPPSNISATECEVRRNRILNAVATMKEVFSFTNVTLEQLRAEFHALPEISDAFKLFNISESNLEGLGTVTLADLKASVGGNVKYIAWECEVDGAYSSMQCEANVDGAKTACFCVDGETGMMIGDMITQPQEPVCTVCPLGEVPDGQVCIACPVGTYRGDGDELCVPCKPRYTTNNNRATSKLNCSILIPSGCAEGEYFVEDAANCKPCPYGHYQPVADQYSCVQCPQNMTSVTLGATACILDCPSGTAYDNETDSCADCPRGYYRDKSVQNQRDCAKCPDGLITPTPKATSRDMCNIGDCGPGSRISELDPSVCELCPKGTYQADKWQTACINCSFTYTTPTTGANDSSQCSHRVPSECVAGQFFDMQTTSCVHCPYGHYQPKKGQYACIPCGSNYTTLVVGANQCVLDCPSGTEYISTSLSCEFCGRGWYRDRQLTDPLQPACVHCPKNLTTTITNAITVEDCDQGDCQPGWRFDENNKKKCLPCPKGFYQSKKWQANCTQCRSLYTTKHVASVSPVQCNIREPSPCQAGEFYNESSSICQDCPRGRYQDTPAQYTCNLCDSGLTTYKEGSLTCVLDCPSGFSYNENTNTCIPCPRGTYRDRANPDHVSCQFCPPDRITEATGATSRAACNVGNCHAGSYIDPSDKQACLLCPVGEYQPDKWQAQCRKCADTYTTPDEGNTSPRGCSIRVPSGCSIGRYYDMVNRSCVQCGYDTYQPQPDEYACLPCPDSQVTHKTGASQCVPACDSGYEYNATTSSCERCPVGFYRNHTIRSMAQCRSCPPGLTTANATSTSQNDCNLGDCGPGHRRVAGNQSQCEACPKGYYQENKWRSDCKACDPGWTTETTASTSVNDCRPKPSCKAGYIRLTPDAICTPCPVGTYRGVNNTVCLPCSKFRTTPFAGATSRDNCSIYLPTDCQPGYWFNETSSDCDECTIGQYQPTAGQYMCLDCPDGQTSITRAAVNCLPLADCDPGSYTDPNNPTACLPCTKGTYQPAKSQVDCVPCNATYTTTGSGSTHASNCSQRIPSTCDPGYQFNMTSSQCEECSLGQYQPTAGQYSCLTCPDGQTSVTLASTRCLPLADCDPGSYTDPNNPTACLPCTKGTYQPAKSQADCVPCNATYTTTGSGSTHASNCTERVPSTCDRGYWFNETSSKCEACAVGQYQPNAGQYSCLICPDGQTSITSAATLCLPLADCNPGSYTDPNNPTACLPCAKGTYQPAPSQADCVPCDATYTTIGSGSTHKSNCSERVASDCLAGSYYNMTRASCESCDVGYVSSAGQYSCTACPSGQTTVTVGSSQCSLIPSCSPGEYYNVSRSECDQCDYGYYHPRGNRFACIVCPSGQTTYERGSASCSLDCPLGAENRNGTCRVCGRDSYRDKATPDQKLCQKCPDGLITPNPGSQLKSQCYIADCRAGYMISSNDSACIPCPRGQYQPDKWQRDCKDCPDRRTTAMVASTERGDCNIVECPALKCDGGECRYGYMKDSDNCSTCDCFEPCAEHICYNGTVCTVAANLTVSCIIVCIPPQMTCEFGHVVDSNGCETNQCYDPCDGVRCPDSREFCVADSRNTTRCASQKTGNCPATVMGSCTRNCINDMSCLGNQKCCFNKCSYVCAVPEEPPENDTCYEVLQAAYKHLVYDPRAPIMIPRCNKVTRTWLPLQCDPFGICWCVDERGVEEENSRRRGVPNCNFKRHTPPATLDCPPGRLSRRCDPGMLLRAYCPADPQAIPVIYSCGVCEVRFYSHLLLTPVECSTPTLVCHKRLGDSLTSHAQQYNVMQLVERVKGHLQTDGAQLHIYPERPWPIGYIDSKQLARETFPFPLHSLCYLSTLSSTGDCAIKQRWYFYVRTSQCQPFTFSGCDSNGNHFTSQDECSKFCSVNKNRVTYLRGTHLEFCRESLYDHKQCHNDYCWCVNRQTGGYIVGSLTRSNLVCYGNGTFKSSTNIACLGGVIPRPCSDACERSSCPGHPDAVCYVDPCSENCVARYRNKRGEFVNCDASENICHQHPELGSCSLAVTRWFFNTTTERCEQFTYSGCNGNVNRFYTHFLCQQGCDRRVVSGSELGCKPKSCSNTCTRNTCRLFREAACMVDPCTCEAHFYDPHTRARVNCDEVASKCVRDRAMAINDLSAARRTHTVIYIPECDKNHTRFLPKQCSSTQCFCVDGDGLVISNTTQTRDDGLNNLYCGERAIAVKTVRIVLKAIFKEIVADKQEEEELTKRILEALEKIIPDLALKLVDRIKLSEGSIIVEIVFKENATIPVDVSSAADAVERQAAEGKLTVTMKGQKLTADPNQVSHFNEYRQEPAPRPPTTPGTTQVPSNTTRIGVDGETQTVLIAVAACVAVLLTGLMGALVMICRQCRKNAQHKLETPPSDSSSSEMAVAAPMYYHGSILAPDNRIMKRSHDYFPSHELYDDYASVE